MEILDGIDGIDFRDGCAGFVMQDTDEQLVNVIISEEAFGDNQVFFGNSNEQKKSAIIRNEAMIAIVVQKKIQNNDFVVHDNRKAVTIRSADVSAVLSRAG